jgi:hypothetical protein
MLLVTGAKEIGTLHGFTLTKPVNEKFKLSCSFKLYLGLYTNVVNISENIISVINSYTIIIMG